jgi:hypothetical protein
MTNNQLYNLALGFTCFVALYAGAWFSVNLQFVNHRFQSSSFELMLLLAIPTNLLAYYGTRFSYAALDNSAWAVRFFGFSVSYLVFPILTWALLGESMFTTKAALSVILSIMIVLVQVYM